MAVVKSEDAVELSGSVEITGELRFDETLSVDITGIETEDPVTLAYRWYRCNDGRGTGAALVGSGDKYTLTRRGHWQIHKGHRHGGECRRHPVRHDVQRREKGKRPGRAD